MARHIADREQQLHRAQQVLEERLRVMHAAAISLCRDNAIPIVLFDLGRRGNILRAVCGEAVGSTVRE